MKMLRWSMLVVVIGLLWTTPATPADREFNVRDVRGAFGFLLDGTADGFPVAISGRFVADGAGHLTDGVRTFVLAGTAIRQTFTCTYSVNPDGTGDATCDLDTPGMTETFAFVLTDRGHEALAVGTTPRTTIRGFIKRQ